MRTNSSDMSYRSLERSSHERCSSTRWVDFAGLEKVKTPEQSSPDEIADRIDQEYREVPRTSLPRGTAAIKSGQDNANAAWRNRACGLLMVKNLLQNPRSRQARSNSGLDQQGSLTERKD